MGIVRMRHLWPPLMGGAPTYGQRVLALPGLVAYWPLDEISGTVATSLTAIPNGAYTNAPALANAPFPSGGAAPLFNGVDEAVNIYSAALSAALNWATGWALAWVRIPNAAVWLDATGRNALNLYVDGSNAIQITKGVTNNELRVSYEGANTIVYAVLPAGSARWIQVAMRWSAGALTASRDGVDIGTVAGVVTGAGNLSVSYSAIAASRGNGAASQWSGNVAHVAIGAGAVPTEAQLEQLWHVVYPGAREITFSGDSKTAGDSWCNLLAAGIEATTGLVWRERPPRLAVGGYNAAQLHTYIDANAPGVLGEPSIICLNIGINDLTAGTAEATFKTQLVGCIDGLRTRWPSASIYIACPWLRGKNVQAAAMKVWIAAVIALYATGVAAGPDETVWLEGGNDGATMTVDGTHYSAAGQLAAAAQWLTALGY